MAIELPQARVEGSTLFTHALSFDRFGNVMLGVEHQDLTGLGLRLGDPVLVNGEDARYASTFVDVAPSGLLLYEDAYRALSLAVNRGSAAERLGLDVDAEVRIAAPAR
jgi:S-adenosylmethionine hydrolase